MNCPDRVRICQLFQQFLDLIACSARHYQDIFNPGGRKGCHHLPKNGCITPGQYQLGAAHAPGLPGSQ
jgi:hypothetical protein